MKEYQLEAIGFKSYIKLIFLSSFGMGVIMGCFMFILSLFDKESVWVRIGNTVSTGIIAGLEAIIICPITMCILFSFFGLFLYLGFKLVMKFKKNLKLKLKIEE